MATILLIEDDADLAEIWSELLELQGHGVRVAPTLGALGVLEVADTDLAVVDWTLPDGSGEQAIADLRRRGFRGRLVITTGHGQDQVPEGQSDVDAILRKPFRVRDLKRVIGNLTSAGSS